MVIALVDILRKNKLIFLFPILIVYFELIIKIAAFKTFFDIGVLIMTMFSIPIGLIIYLLSTLSNEKTNKVIAILFILLLTCIYVAQFLYYKIFSTFLSLYSFIGASDAMQFWEEGIRAILKGIVPLLLFLLPISLILVFNKKITSIFTVPDKKIKIIVAVIAAIIQAVTLCMVLNSNSGDLSPRYLYSESFIIDISVEKFGLLTTEKLDLKNLLKSLNAFSGNTENVDKNSLNNDKNVYAIEKISTPSAIKDDTAEKEPEFNMLDINFEALIQNEKDGEIKEMHQYFGSLQPSQKNEYTGKFKGKNLILITAEGFSPYVVNKDLTPTLYKMYEEGYKFTDFYTPLWGVSTSDGEYVACTGLIPKAGIWSFFRSAQNYMPFCMGNQLRAHGYNTYAYHDHYFDYYERDKSHPNMGYEYKGLGNGLNLTETWPESDVEMIDVTAPEYIGKQPFHTYYMTVSGHLQYTFNGNYMSFKNKALVEHLNYSEEVKAYLACNIELDRAMELLIRKLEEAGIADDTVIAISPDHYPYGLEISKIGELAGHDIETNFEIYKGIFLLWSKGIEPVTIDEPCSSLDIMPTLSNLMGLEFDSRLFMGRDMMSDTEPLVLFNNRSWITDKASYNAVTGELCTKDGVVLDDNYKKKISDEVKQKFKYSALILESDYYRRIIK